MPRKYRFYFSDVLIHLDQLSRAETADFRRQRKRGLIDG
jgi:hypothetical protein